MISENKKSDNLERVAETYRPEPVNLDGITLPVSLTLLTEAIAENTHNVWAQARLKQGWSYGPLRDDNKKHHPDLVPYSYLSEEEKEYDRASAISAIKLIVKLGYVIGNK